MKEIKPNRKTWICGTSAGGKPSFPPVVPWITPALKEQLTDFLTSSMVWRQDESGKEIAKLEAQITQLRTKHAPSFVDRRKLNNLTNQRDALLTTTEKKLKGVREKMADEVATFSLVRGLRAISLCDKHDFLGDITAPAVVFTTAPIKINSVILGTYDIFLNPRLVVPYNAFDLVRRDGRFPRGYHPHYTSGPCYGSYGPVLQKMLVNGSFAVAIGTYLNYLAIYNGRSPLCQLKNFRSGSYANNSPLV